MAKKKPNYEDNPPQRPYEKELQEALRAVPEVFWPAIVDMAWSYSDFDSGVYDTMREATIETARDMAGRLCSPLAEMIARQQELISLPNMKRPDTK